MNTHTNPFEYEAANRLSVEEILSFYIEDFNYSRFVRSKRNTFFVGERGTGKTMTLLYNSLPVQIKKHNSVNEPLLDFVCIYIPCNTPITHKTEHNLLDGFQGSTISEHFLVTSIMYEIANVLGKIPQIINADEELLLRKMLSYSLGLIVPPEMEMILGLKLAIQKESIDAQTALNEKRLDAFYDNARTFSTGVLPLLTALKEISKLSESHFVLMLDDAQELNQHQIKALNSWIAYRGNALFSLKVACTKVDPPPHHTAYGGTILEGHDFITVDMELPYQNKFSSFGKLARQIVERRLSKINLSNTAPDTFFPISPEFAADLKTCEGKVKNDAQSLFQQGTTKQIADYVYKFGRAEYFRQRSAKANRPPYSGFDVLVHISTGVIRNLLEPCYWMYDKALSEHRAAGKTTQIECINPHIQTEILLERSSKKWSWLRSGLDKTIVECSEADATRLYSLFDNLAILFRERLLAHKSEPRAITFTISELEFDKRSHLLKLLHIARKAQLLYTYASAAKDSGRREVYYVPNRILWPDRGLDPHGQHARVSIRAKDLWAAADQNKKLPFDGPDAPESKENQPIEMDLFDE